MIISKLVETLAIARRCRRAIMQNFVGTLAVDAAGVGLAAFGFLNPLLAAFIHVSSGNDLYFEFREAPPAAGLQASYGTGCLFA